MIWDVTVVFSGSQDFEVEADSHEEAIQKARQEFNWDMVEFDIDSIDIWEQD